VNCDVVSENVPTTFAVDVQLPVSGGVLLLLLAAFTVTVAFACGEDPALFDALRV
jgi:hypothetical protein